MATISINVSLEKELNDTAQSIFSALGLDMSTAINMLLTKAVYPKGAPPKKPIDRSAGFGCLKGQISVPDDFDEPLEDFKEQP